MDFDDFVMSNYVQKSHSFQTLLQSETEENEKQVVVMCSASQDTRGSAYDVFIRFLNDCQIPQQISDKYVFVKQSSRPGKHFWVTNDISMPLSLVPEKSRVININCRENSQITPGLYDVTNFAIQGHKMTGNPSTNIFLDSDIRKAGKEPSQCFAPLLESPVLINLSMNSLEDNAFHGKRVSNTLGMSQQEVLDIVSLMGRMEEVCLVLSDFFPEVEYELSVGFMIQIFMGYIQV